MTSTQDINTVLGRLLYRKTGLLSRSNVNANVHGEPLIIQYLRKKLNFKVLLAFARNGCDFNVKGSNGQTPLHIVVARKLYSEQVKNIELLISHGADMCAVDNDGNNALMVAVLMGQDQVVSEFLTKYRTVAQRLVTQKNKYGHDVVALFCFSCHRYGYIQETCLKQLVELGADFTSTDNNGDNCLHHLVRSPYDRYHSMSYYHETNDHKDSNLALEYRKRMLKSHLNLLINAGADISEQNNNGFIPLQAALSSHHVMFDSLLDLEPLVPDEDVLEHLVPRLDIATMVKDHLNVSVQVWLVPQMTRFGFKSPKDTLSMVRASNYCETRLIRQLIRRGVKPTAEDLKVPLSNRNADEVVLYIMNMSPKDLSDLKQVIPDIIGQIIALRDNAHLNTKHLVELLVSNGLAITVYDLKVALEKKYLKIVELLLTYMDNSYEEQIKREMPDILIQFLRINHSRYSSTIEEVQIIVEQIVNKFNINVNYVSNSDDSVIQCIMDIVCKGQQPETKAIQLFDFIAKLNELDLDMSVKHEHSESFREYRLTETIIIRPIQMAMQMKKFGLVIKLIIAGADCRGLEFDNLKRNQFAVKLIKLLYHLGIYVNIVKSDLIFNWAQKQPLKSLQELAAMAVRRNCTQKELKEAIADIVLPDNVYSYLDLEHLTLNDQLYSDQTSSVYLDRFGLFV